MPVFVRTAKERGEAPDTSDLTTARKILKKWGEEQVLTAARHRDGERPH